MAKYTIAIDWELEFKENPKFYCEDFEELTRMIQFFFRSGHTLIIEELDE